MQTQTQTQTPLETAFADLCAKHGTYTFELSIHLKQSEAARFGCTIHHAGPTIFNGCVIAHGATMQEAINKAVAALAADRAVEVDIPALTLDVAA